MDGVNNVQSIDEGNIFSNVGESGGVNILRRGDGGISVNNVDEAKHARVQDALVIEQTLVGEGVGSGVGLGRLREEDTSAVDFTGWGFDDVIAKREKKRDQRQEIRRKDRRQLG